MDLKIEEDMMVAAGLYADEEEVCFTDTKLILMNLGSKVYAKIGEHFYSASDLHYMASKVKVAQAAFELYTKSEEA